MNMNNDNASQDLEERADALAEEILMLFVMDGMEAKEQVKQLLVRFATGNPIEVH